MAGWLGGAAGCVPEQGLAGHSQGRVAVKYTGVEVHRVHGCCFPALPCPATSCPACPQPHLLHDGAELLLADRVAGARPLLHRIHDLRTHTNMINNMTPPLTIRAHTNIINTMIPPLTTKAQPSDAHAHSAAATRFAAQHLASRAAVKPQRLVLQSEPPKGFLKNTQHSHHPGRPGGR